MNLKIDLAAPLFILLLCISCTQEIQDQAWEYNPRNYVVMRSSEPVIIDGHLTDRVWKEVAWTSYFHNIEGESFPQPDFKTRAKITWDENYLYIGAELEEPDIWATFTERESIIFHENNFEIFIDPDGDTHNYYEYEINALGTEWDLLMKKPYRDGGPSDSSWDIIGIKSAVHLMGTINDGRDIDEGWTVEVAIPWSNVTDEVPQEGTIWRMNFSRVEWEREVDENGKYSKVMGTNNKPVPEQNWVWSPTGEINMHMPERWGFVQFTELESGQEKAFVGDGEDEIRWKLRQVYYLQKEYIEKEGMAAASLEVLGLSDLAEQGVTMEVDGRSFTAVLENWYIESDSKIWFKSPK